MKSFFLLMCIIFSVNSSCEEPCWVCSKKESNQWGSVINTFDTCERSIMELWRDRGFRCRRK